MRERSCFYVILLAALPVLAASGFAQSDPKASPSPSPSVSAAPSATPIPLADVVAAAEAASERLTQTDTELAAANETSATITRELPSLAEAISALAQETSRLLAPGTPLDRLRQLELRWQKFADQLASWARDLTTRATYLDREIAQLPELRSTWKLTAEAARGSAAPPEVTQRIDAVLKGIDQTMSALQKRRAAVLSLQSRVAEQTQRVAAGIRSVKAGADAAIDRLWVQDSPPIWSREVREAAKGDLVGQSQVSFGTQLLQLRAYLAREWTRLIYFALLLLGLAFVLCGIRRRAARWTADDPALERANRVLQLPIATASVLAFLCCRPLFPEAPRLFWVVLATLTLVPLVYLLRRLIDRHLFPVLHALVVFYVVAQFRALAAALPVLSRIILLLEMVGGAIFLLWFIGATRRSTHGTTSRKATRAAARVGVVLFIAVFVANSLGYVALANYLSVGALATAYLAILLYAAAGILEGLTFFALQIPPLSSLAMVRNYRPLLRARTARVIYFAAFIVWLLLALGAFNLREATYQRVLTIVNAEVAIRSLHLSLGALLAFVLTITVALLLSRFVRFVLEEDIYERVRLARGSAYAVSTILHYIILLVGFFAALAAVGVDMTKFAILAGAFGVGIGFGLKNIFNNFFSGLILLFERPIQVGDVVEVGSATGVVRRIGIRASIIRLPNNSELIVPNGQLISEKVTNRTVSSRQQTMQLRIGVAYGSDPARVLELLTQAAAAHPQVAKTPAPEAFMREFGTDALLFELVFSTEMPQRAPRIQSDVAVAVNSALSAAGIEIPFPHRVVHLQEAAEGDVT
ncbi:MAG: mechanosensitive ion channel [Verrucomicrobiota bacterium]|nr:mechanosensitive ion channel [Verrucomicrobiota bacterium]